MAGAVSKLLFDESSGSCYGVSLEDGKEFIATKIVLATGANTAKIIADSAPDRKDIQVEDRITGAAVVTGAVRLNDAQMKHYGSMPVFIHRVGESLSFSIHMSGGRPSLDNSPVSKFRAREVEARSTPAYHRIALS